jgi:uncharacterized protein
MKMKVISRDGTYVAVNLENLNIFRVDACEAEILSLYNKGFFVPDIASKVGMPEKECESIIKTFCSTPKGVSVVPEEVGVLDEILLMVALDCNMRCGYCYGDGGSYQRKRTLMDKKTAVKAVDTFTSLGDIKTITFFGGEPLLNFSVIKTVVEYAPAITCGIITNGTIMTQEMADFIKAHKLPLTLSIDGPQPVHDAARQYVDGRGTHKTIMKTVDVLKAKKIPFAVEATYSKKALLYSAKEVLEYLYQITPVINFATVAVVDDPEYKLSPQEYKEVRVQAIDFAFDKIEKGEPLNVIDITALAYSIARTERIIPQVFCPYHARRVAVFPNGDVYPCYLITDPKYYYGNIFDSDFVQKFPGKSKEILPQLCRDKLINAPWFTPLMTHICMGTLVSQGEYFSLRDDLVSYGPEAMEYLLYRMSRIRDWKSFFENVQKAL